MEKFFELSRRNRKNGRRKFKLVLHEIYNDDCVDRSKGEGSIYNENGITWIQEYCEKQLDTIAGTSLRVEFLDEDRTEICGHGDTGIEDGMPVFENATVIGNFTNGYIEEIVIDDHLIKAVVGEGEIDASCYPALVKKFESDLNKGMYPRCSVEICHTDEYETIQYLGGYKEKGRIPTDFQYSGCALLGIAPADDKARLLELNQKENHMNVEEIRSLINDAIASFVSTQSECNSKVSEAEKCAEEAATALNACQSEKDKADERCAALESENKALKEECEKLREELMKCKKNERCSKLDQAISNYSDTEKSYAEAEINAFKEKTYDSVPTDEMIASEINSVVNAILCGIGKASKEKEAAEINSAQNTTKTIDIFEGVNVSESKSVDIF